MKIKKILHIVLTISLCICIFSGCANKKEKLITEITEATIELESKKESLSELESLLNEQEKLYNSLDDKGTFEKTDEANQVQEDSLLIREKTNKEITSLKTHISLLELQIEYKKEDLTNLEK